MTTVPSKVDFGERAASENVYDNRRVNIALIADNMARHGEKKKKKKSALDDNLIRTGGDSILAMRLVSTLWKKDFDDRSYG